MVEDAEDPVEEEGTTVAITRMEVKLPSSQTLSCHKEEETILKDGAEWEAEMKVEAMVKVEDEAMGGLVDEEEREDEIQADKEDAERIHPMLKTIRKNQKSTINRDKKSRSNPTKTKAPTKRPSKRKRLTTRRQNQPT
jgi:hypothetical protein